MATSYTRNTYVDGSTPALSAANLNKPEAFLAAIASGGAGSVVKADLASDSLLLNGKNLTAQRKLSDGLICAPKANIPEYPDNVAGTTYKSLPGWTSGVDGWQVWSAGAVNIRIENGLLKADGNGALTGIGVKLASLPIYNIGHRIAFKYDPDITFFTYWNGSANVDVPFIVVGNKMILDYIANYGSYTQNNIMARYASTAIAATKTIAIEFIYIGDGTYSSLALDASGNGNHGTVYGCTPVAGITGRALQFDGVDDAIRDTAWLSLGTGSASVALWIKCDTAPGTNVGLIDQASSTSGSRFGVYINATGRIYLLLRDDSAVTLLSGSTAGSFCDGIYHSIVVTFDRSTNIYTIFVDGTLNASGVIGAGGSITASGTFNIGRLYNTGTFYSGIIDDPRIYNRALSAEEIWELYQNPGGAEINDMVMASTPVANSVAVRTSTGILEANGIKFPGTQSASTDANTLDDYEEGTFTPAISFGGASVGMTFTTQVGSYTKIGNRVLFSAIIVLSAKGSSTGSALLTGLPFTALDSVNNAAVVSLGALSAVTYVGVPSGAIARNTTTINMWETTEAGSRTALANTDFADTSIVYASGHYYV